MSLLMEALYKAEAQKRAAEQEKRLLLESQNESLSTPFRPSDPVATFENQNQLEQARIVPVDSRMTSPESEPTHPIVAVAESRHLGRLERVIRQLWVIASLLAAVALFEVYVGWQLYEKVIELVPVVKGQQG